MTMRLSVVISIIVCTSGLDGKKFLRQRVLKLPGAELAVVVKSYIAEDLRKPISAVFSVRSSAISTLMSTLRITVHRNSKRLH